TGREPSPKKARLRGLGRLRSADGLVAEHLRDARGAGAEHGARDPARQPADAATELLAAVGAREEGRGAREAGAEARDESRSGRRSRTGLHSRLLRLERLLLHELRRRAVGDREPPQHGPGWVADDGRRHGYGSTVNV